MNHPLVEFDLVSKSFDDKLLIDKVSFRLNPNEITTLMGQNGAGKTTIAKIILGLEQATKGKVTIKKHIKIGYAPQKLDFNFNMPLTVAGLLKILAPNGIASDVLQLIHFIDIDSIKNIDVGKLSGGQLQKLVLAGTLLNKPDLVILDEPTQYLDVTSQQEFYKDLNQIKEKIGITVFMISHDLFAVMKNSDQVICINGHVCCIGTPTDIEQNNNLKNALSEIGVYIHKHNHTH